MKHNMDYLVKIPKKLRNELWWLVVSVDFNYSRITIADHEIDEEVLTVWLEDKQDFKNSLDECLQLQISLKQFAKVINAERLNSYETVLMHPHKKFLYKTNVLINEAIAWYNNDATFIEQQWARESLLKKLLTQLIETDLFSGLDYAK
ncbi:hypothetical protein [Mucilaginibacter ginkgonis]|uniref:Uncharacterized protein n=1 Tax=Mucilaginibacter ginkgonis TaxID=2682091 RepID=A0A6I4HU90_9SPHI|nr:hypothetical protein [Mucilaginibacter ginkgonis]QQL50347.1 hypothetical protein GO620_002510 [Mucilaginibacter ginkgonis]